MSTCRNRDGLAFGVCGGELVAMTLWGRLRLWCKKCGKPGSDRRKD